MKKLILVFITFLLIGCSENYAPVIKSDMNVYATYELGVNFTDHMLALISSNPNYASYKVRYSEVLEKTNYNNLNKYYELIYTHKTSYIYPQIFYYIPTANNFDTVDKWNEYFDDWTKAINKQDIEPIIKYVENLDIKDYIADVFKNTDENTWDVKYIEYLGIIEDLNSIFVNQFEIYEKNIWPSLSFDLHKKSENINSVLRRSDVVGDWEKLNNNNFIDEQLIFSLSAIDNPDIYYLNINDKVIMYFNETLEITEFVEVISHRVGYEMLQDNFSDVIINSYNEYEYMSEYFNIYEIIDTVLNKLVARYNAELFGFETYDYRMYFDGSNEYMDQIISHEVYLNGTLVESALRISLNNVFAKTAYDNMLVINDVLNYHGYEFEKMDISDELNDITVHYHDFDSVIIEKDGFFEVVIKYYENTPRLSVKGDKLLYINPDEFEAIGDIYIYDLKSMTSEMILDSPETSNFKVKRVEWYDDNTIYMIQGLAHGTISKGGLLYKYNIRREKLELVKIPLEERQEIVDVKVINDILYLNIITFDEEYDNYSETELIIKIVD